MFDMNTMLELGPALSPQDSWPPC